MIKKIFLAALLLLTIYSCATLDKQIKGNPIIIETSNKEINHTFYLIGDTGNSPLNNSKEALISLEELLKNATKNTTVLFLGNNTYLNSLQKKESLNRDFAEHSLQIQIESVKNFKGNTIFIPGNHDWCNGVEGLKKQQQFVENQLGKNSFLPKNGNPIKTLEISDDIVLIIVDSQWYITNWDKHPTINDDSDIKTRGQFLEEFRQEVKKARGKTTLVAIHHPLFSNGPHGGQYAFNDYIKPFPILGSFKNIFRKTSGILNADISNKFYNELRKNLITAARQNDRVIFISGHEHSLQYLIQDSIPQIISGSGSKLTQTHNTNGGQFSFAKNGFAVVDVYKDGTTTARFISANENKIDFETQVLKSNHLKNQINDFQVLKQDSIQKAIYTIEETAKNKLHKFLWGERYRKYYSTPITAKIVYLDTLLGGLTPFRKGGGNQSKTLQLVSSNGKRYVLRALKKQASQYIQATLFKDQYVENQLKNTASENLIKDIFTGAHPYAPFTIVTLSEAIDLPHLNSKLYYIPKQESLGNFNNEFGDELYLFEEHASDGHNELALGNFTGNIINTMDLINKIHSDESIAIDERTYIKARLFDMLIGDWDRHQDQWRWLEIRENNKTIYSPLPRDRDQPFSKMSDGFILGSAVKLIPQIRLIRNYESNLMDVKGFNTESFPLDIALITHSGKTIWDEEVRLIQNNITDKIIDKAFRNIPKEVNDETTDEIKKTLKYRRKNLQKIADKYYKLLFKNVVITGTNKDDYIKVNINERDEVSVSISRKKGTTIKDEFHNKTYYPATTKEIWIYGLDDDDTFDVKGRSNKIKIRLIGGQNNDEFNIENGKNTIIYDYKSKKNKTDNIANATLKLQDKYNINVYDYNKTKKSTNQLTPILGFNPDDGFILGLNNTFTVSGFERNPFTSQHQLKASLFFETKGYFLSYKGEFANILGNTNLLIESKFQSPNFSLNFFGYGNETQNLDDDLGLDYNRVKVREFNITPSLVWKAYGGTEVGLGAKYESIEVQETKDRFVENNPELPDFIFESNRFASINTRFYFENYDSKAYPTMGITTSIELGHKISLEESNQSFTYLIPQLIVVHKLNTTGNLVFATKLKSQINFNNNNFKFYQAAAIGGNDGLRGYRNQRFTGNKSFYQNTDIRYIFNNISSLLIPLKVGLFGGVDYGRIWLDQQDSKKWHNSYGGGVFINGVNTMTANLGVFNSNDGLRVTFNFGFGF